MEVSFCQECSDKILSRRLSFFWKFMCVNVASEHTWMGFKETDEEALKYIRILEKKLFMVSTEYEDKILVKPHGIHESEQGDYIVCLCLHKHFHNIVTGEKNSE